MVQRTAIGNVYQLPLPDGRFAFAQYLQWSESDGPLVQVYDLILDRELRSLAELNEARALFPPVFVSLATCTRSGRWKRVGTRPVPEFEFPTFRAIDVFKPGTYEGWSLWDGYEVKFIGKLPRDLRSLEVLFVWGCEGLEERIATGRNLFDEVL